MTAMRREDFHFNLPPGLIATEPPAERESAKLMTVDRNSGTVSEATISSLPGLLRPFDLLILNDTKVIPARLHGFKGTGGKVEIFLVRRLAGEGELWEALLRSSKPFLPGAVITLPEEVIATVMSTGSEEARVISFSGTDDFFAWLDRNGAVPLPPYIKRAPHEKDRDRYQTVFAKERGAVAAPTAGLHFTEPLLDSIRSKGVEVATITLHVGLGTFMPVRTENLREHKMHKERYSIPEATVSAVARCRASGGRVIAVGTTVARTLEYASVGDLPREGAGEADIFIYPGYQFKVVDALITNFHLPESTLLMLVSAFAGRELILDAYKLAVERKFRFFSYGDAMFIS
jgi:S-adenosylmethionine:tRNA ribosyltransferase-isomerase